MPACPLLATSRQALAIAGETAWLMPPMLLPASITADEGQEASANALQRSEAARLFFERATAVQPGFALTARNVPSVAEICRRLDGIPLAIELAAARVRVLSVEQIAARLEDRFRRFCDISLGSAQSGPVCAVEIEVPLRLPISGRDGLQTQTSLI